MNPPAVHLAIDGTIATITLHRPACRNAVDGPTALALREAFERFEADETLRVAVFTGGGGQFCAGADLAAVADGERRNTVLPDGSGPGPMGPTHLHFSKPVIAAVEGYAVAGGLELALMCDLRVAARSAVFGVFCRRWGVPLIDGGTVRLPRIVGQARALDLILTGRAVAADEALAIGLANRVVDDGQALAEALALARQIAAFPQACLRADRASALAQWDWPLADALQREGAGGHAALQAEGLAGAAQFRPAPAGMVGEGGRQPPHLGGQTPIARRSKPPLMLVNAHTGVRPYFAALACHRGPPTPETRMSILPDTAGPSAEPLTDFSQCHVGITSRLKALAGLPALLEPAAQARHLAAESLTFFDEVIEEHHGSEERELFPAVIASAVRGEERDRVQALADRLVAEHRQIEAQWARLVPGLKEAAKGRDSTLDGAAVQKLVDAYLAHAAFEEREFLPLSQTILSRDNNHMAALAIALHMRHTVPAALARWGHRI